MTPARFLMGTIFLVNNWRASEANETLSGLYMKIGDMVRAISVNSVGLPYSARFTAVVKIPLPLATF